MELTDLPTLVPDFHRLPNPDKVKHFAWYLHSCSKLDWFRTGEVRACFEVLHLDVPNVADILARLASRRPKVLLRNGHEYKLELSTRQALDAKYGKRPISIAVEKSLTELPTRLSDETRRKYLVEALDCYRAGCFRASILMTWNLAYDHLIGWLLADPGRVARFNMKLPAKPPFSSGLVVSKRDDLEWLKESEVVSICGHKDVAIIPANLKKILNEALDWRNMSAHPATIEIRQVTAEHTISNLVENVVLRLT